MEEVSVHLVLPVDQFRCGEGEGHKLHMKWQG